MSAEQPAPACLDRDVRAEALAEAAAAGSGEAARALCFEVAGYLVRDEPMPLAVRVRLAQAFLSASESGGSLDAELGIKRGKGNRKTHDPQTMLLEAIVIHRAVRNHLSSSSRPTEAYAEVAELFELDESTVGKKYRHIQEALDNPEKHPARYRQIQLWLTAEKKAHMQLFGPMD